MPIHHRAITLALAVILGLLAFVALQSAAQAQTVTDRIHAAVALERCTQQTFTMIDDIRFGMYLVRVSGYESTLGHITDDLRDTRRTLDVDCSNIATQNEMQSFTRDVLPQMRSVR